jgi:two-component system nitrogen regulation sensor histidine kinase NtrY
MIILIVLSFMIIGSITIWYTKSENERYHDERLLRKQTAVTASLDYYLRDHREETNTFYTRDFHQKMLEISDVHGLEIILYDLNGSWISSSNFGFFDAGILPDSLARDVLKGLEANNGEYVVRAEGEKNQMLSAYRFIRNIDNNPVAIVNIPYFASNDQSKEETAEFLITLSQVYAVLLVASLIIAYFLSNYITGGLKTIGNRIRMLNLTGSGEPLNWPANDEIGELVREYNSKVKELEESANQLAKSERESAWREMARQVAHEIKNPLTPMKLSVQQLERSWNDGREDFAVRLEKFTEMMTDQIDNLSHIATEFSNFAKLPKANPELISPEEQIKKVLELFGKDKTEIDFIVDVSAHGLKINMDKLHFDRIMINLIKNAQQAVEDKPKPSIRVSLSKTDMGCKIDVEDNGIGIQESDLQSIFHPNFTTKSGGTGLGLAMVKSMLNQAGGDISVTSEPGKGSAFSITLITLRVD